MKDVFIAIVPGWEGHALPDAFPRSVRWLLKLSASIVNIAALLRHHRTYASLDTEQREQLLAHLADHRLAPIRGLVTWWKLLALILRA